jgi:hypothetical protein
MDSENKNRPVSGKIQETNGRKMIVALFHDLTHAEDAINALKDAGFKGNEVGVALHEKAWQGEMAYATGTTPSKEGVKRVSGGGTPAWISGYLPDLGTRTIPGVGPVVTGGALAKTLTGAPIGSLQGALLNIGLPQEEAQQLESGFRSGGELVCVIPGKRGSEAANILQRHGGDFGNIGKPLYQ